MFLAACLSLFCTLLLPSGLHRCLFVSCLNLFCMLLVPSGFCRCFVPCLNFVLHAALAIGALHVLRCDMFESALHASLPVGALRVLVLSHV